MDGKRTMTGKQARQTKSRWQFAVGVAFATLICLLSVWVVLHRLTTSSIDPASLDPLSSPNRASKAPERPMLGSSAQQRSPTPAATQQAPLPAAKQPTDKLSTGKLSTGKVTLRQGVFRVGNPTSYPVRVALLSKKAGEAGTPNAGEATYELPAHWDFAPEEGGADGLLVSLPDRTLKLKKGDVLVAFAQDGSGRYWGPYVVDETVLPLWNAKAVEWQLILRP